MTNDQIHLTTLQEERTAGVRLYRPHNGDHKPKAFDWDALTPSCRTCGTKTGQLNRDDQCRSCAPTEPPQEPAAAPRAKKRPTRRSKRPAARRETRPDRAGRPGKTALALDEAAIIEAYRGGQTASSIAEALDCSAATVVRVLHRAGVELRPGRQRVVRRRPSGNGSGRPGKSVDERAIVEQYEAGDSAPTLARRHGILPKRVRAIVERHGVRLRDDRATHSGGQEKEYDPDVCAAVERLYVVDGLSQSQVADRLGLTRKVVQSIMHRRGVRAREAQSGKGDTLGALRDELKALDVTTRQIKEWGLERGLVDHIARGMPSKALVEAYAAAARGDAT